MKAFSIIGEEHTECFEVTSEVREAANFTPFNQAALYLLSYAHIAATPKDVIVLGEDLRVVVDEFKNQTVPNEELATRAAHVLCQRIGGSANLKLYLATLHAGRKS